MDIRRLQKTIQSVIFAVLLVPTVVLAEDGHDAHDAEHSFHNNVLGLFLGATGEDRRDADFTLGIEYERLINQSFGIGGVIEHASGGHDFWVFAVPIAYHIGAWKWYVASGVEKEKGHSNELLFRVGVEYGFEVGDFEIAPQFDVDFVDGDKEYVFGVVIARGF